jgi:hypothetical protein
MANNKDHFWGLVSVYTHSVDNSEFNCILSAFERKNAASL